MSDLDQQFDRIRRIRGTYIERGLACGELDQAEAQFRFRFPPDLRELLGYGLPAGERWPNWRAAIENPEGPSAVYLQEQLTWPLRGMLVDIRHDSFWDPDWGTRPTALADALGIATEAVQAAPRLIPVFSHRYLPAEPCIAGNPVLSVYQTDIIVYGRDLHSYFQAESGSFDAVLCEGWRAIRCWTRWMLAEWEYER